MKKNKLKALIKEAFLAEGKNTLLNENAPGFDNRKQGGPLPTLEGIKAAYEAKNSKEAVNEDEFAPYDTLIGPVIAGMVDIRKYVENIAPEHLEAFEKADRALMAFNEKMAYGDNDLGVPGDNALGLEEDKTSGKDVSIAEDTLEGDGLVDSSLENLEKAVRNLAHTADMSEVNAAEMAINHIQDMFSEEELEEGEEDDYDPGALAKVGERTTNGIVVKNTPQVKVHYDTGDVQVLEKENGVWVEVDYHKASLEEAKMDKEFKQMYAADRKSKELIRIANELFPDIAAKQEGGKLVNFIPLSNEQRDKVYAEYAKKPVDENLDKVNLANVTATKANAAIINAPTMGAVLLKVYKQLQDKEQTDFSTNQDLKVVLAKLEKLASQVQGAGKSSSDAELKESIITEADMIVESFKSKGKPVKEAISSGAKQIYTNKPLRNLIIKFIESELKTGQSVDEVFSGGGMDEIAEMYIEKYVTEKEPHYKFIAKSKEDVNYWVEALKLHLQGRID